MLIVQITARSDASLSPHLNRQICLCAAPISSLSTEAGTESPQNPRFRGLISPQEVNADAYFHR